MIHTTTNFVVVSILVIVIIHRNRTLAVLVIFFLQLTNVIVLSLKLVLKGRKLRVLLKDLIDPAFAEKLKFVEGFAFDWDAKCVTEGSAEEASTGDRTDSC